MARGGARSGSGRPKKFPNDPKMLKYWNAFNLQKYHAINRRNIEWHFTFEEWISWWGDDIEKRGHCKGQLVMARYGDLGPYKADNVRKATVEENNRDKIGHKQNKRTPKFCELKRKQAYEQWARRRMLNENQTPKTT